jgi:hypothetical protein
MTKKSRLHLSSLIMSVGWLQVARLEGDLFDACNVCTSFPLQDLAAVPVYRAIRSQQTQGFQDRAHAIRGSARCNSMEDVVELFSVS